MTRTVRTVQSVRNHKAAASGGLNPDPRLALKGLALCLMLAFGSQAHALPVGGAVAAGSATIASSANSMTINQSTQNVAINWQSFSIGQGQGVQFVQPSSSAVALNRVVGQDPSSILGSLSANGKVFLVNPNGILFGPGSQVNVGGLVASTRNITDADFMAGRHRFAGAGGGDVVNQGSITAAGGQVALLGANVSNDGVIVANLGSVALVAGNAVTLDLAGDGLLSVSVDEGAVNAMVRNGGLIRANGGNVLLTAQAAGTLLRTTVNNTGIIEAQTIENRNGTILLMGDMQSGTVNVAGTLDASAPNGGNGGFIETSAAHVKIANDVKITTAAPMGVIGTWLIDPLDFVIAPLGGNISGATLSALLVTNSVVISTLAAPPDTLVAGTPPVTSFNRGAAAPGPGDIFVNDAVSWTAAPSTTTLTLNGLRDVNLNQAITATNGNLVVCCGRDVNVRAAITTVNGSVSLNAGNDLNLFAGSSMTTTNGNIHLCAGHDVIVNSQITLTNSGSIPSQSLGLPLGLSLSAGYGATGPGVAGGTVVFNPLFPATITRSAAPATDVIISYNPTSYATPTDFSLNLIRTGIVNLTENMLVFPGGADKTFDGSTAAIFTGFKTTALSGPVPAGLTLTGAGTATFDTAAEGVDKTITFSGFSLGGTSAGFALPVSCCAPFVGRTTANITPAIVPIAPPVVSPAADSVAVLPILPLLLAGPIPSDLGLTLVGIQMPAQLAAFPTGAVAEAVVLPPEEVPVPVVLPPVVIPLPPRIDRN